MFNFNSYLGLLSLLLCLIKNGESYTLKVHYPSMWSCIDSYHGIPIETEIILGHDQALDSLHGLRHALEGRAADNSTLPLPRLCMTLDKTQQQCFPLDASQFIFTNNIVPGCHSLVAHLEGTDIESDPIVFQVSEPESNMCTQQDRCALSSDNVADMVVSRDGDDILGDHLDFHLPPPPPEVYLKVESPRDGDKVYGDSIVVSLTMETKNGTRLTLGGLLCLNGGSDDCVEITRAMYSEGLTIDLIVRSHEGQDTLRLEPSFRPQSDASSHTLHAHAATIVNFLPIQRRHRHNVVLNESVIDASAGLLLPSLPITLVLSHYEEDIEWISSQPYPVIIYEKKPPMSLQGRRHSVPYNVAGEASAFLKFIVDYYHQLPERILFLHSHRFAYHQEDILIILLRLKDQIQSSDYCNINKVVWGTKEDPDRTFLTHHWDEWLGRNLGDHLPDIFLERCCAQFLVHRDRIRLRSLSFYQEALSRMYECKAKEESRKCGLLMEWIWHYIFGEEAIQAPYLKPLIPLLSQSDRISLHRRPSCLA